MDYGYEPIWKFNVFRYGWCMGIKWLICKVDLKHALDLVWSVYGKYDAKYLERLTHAEKPWVNARQGIDHKERCNNIISKQEIQEYYSGLREIHGICSEYSLNLILSMNKMENNIY